MRAFQATAVLLFATAACIQSHGILVDPKPTIADGVPDKTNYCGTIDGYKALPGEKYDDSPEYNTNAFTRQFNKSSFKSLKALVDAQPTTCGECGITKGDGAPQPLPADGIVKWGHGNEGYVASHEGPCEVWCDATRVYANDNCARNIPDGAMPINVAECKGAKRLFFVWLAMHTSSWQVYKNCVPLSEAGAKTPASPPSAYTPPAAYSPPAAYTPPAAYSPPSAYSAPSAYSPTSAYTPPSAYSPPSGYPPATPLTPSSSVAPPSAPNDGEAKPMQQCGGKRFNGPTRCTSGYTCEAKSEWYSQCVDRNAGSAGYVETWGQCGGQGYTGATTCKPTSQCQVKNNWYSQCVPL